METKTYHGACHCGGVTWDVTAAIESVLYCNCSLCSIRGCAWAFGPAADLTITAGDDLLIPYQFGAKTITHKHCKNCGFLVRSDGEHEGAKMSGFDVRLLTDFDLDSVPRRDINGAEV